MYCLICELMIKLVVETSDCVLSRENTPKICFLLIKLSLILQELTQRIESLFRMKA